MRGNYRDTEWSNRELRRGFTIVELLIVVVVIAILAAITLVAYNGITANARESALKSDLKTASTKLNAEKITGSGSFPSSKPSYIGDSITYAGGGSAFCVSGMTGDKTFHADENGSVRDGACPPPPIQAFTSAQCAALPTFTGSNHDAVRTVTDDRGGITRTYEIAKLADGKCWMLTNLKLGSASGSITLTPADSNVASNFTLPQLTTSSDEELDLPRAYGPVPGDTGAGATNYGYLYNWMTATAGETRTRKPPASPSASYSICPAGWRLPNLQSPVDDSAWLNAKMNNILASEPNSSGGKVYYTNWQFPGPFKGVYSGSWRYSAGLKFMGAGVDGKYWSSTPYEFNIPGSAYYINIQPFAIFPKTNTSRSYGLAVRCLTD